MKISSEASGVSGLDLYFDFSRKFLPDRRNKLIKVMVGSSLGEGPRGAGEGGRPQALGESLREKVEEDKA